MCTDCEVIREIQSCDSHDLFALLLHCDKASNPHSVLMSSALHLRHPVLAVLAACYPVCLKIRVSVNAIIICIRVICAVCYIFKITDLDKF